MKTGTSNNQQPQYYISKNTPPQLSVPKYKGIRKQSSQKVITSSNSIGSENKANIYNEMKEGYNKIGDNQDSRDYQKKGINHNNSLTLSQGSINYTQQSGSKRKIEGNTSIVHFHPDVVLQQNEGGLKPKFFQNGKSQLISTINSIPNFTYATFTGTELGSQFFGTNEQVCEKIIEICSKKIKGDPTNIKLYQKRLQQYIKIGEYDKAISDAEFIIKADPYNILAIQSRGNAFMLKGDIEKALTDFNHVLEIDPDNINAALTKASCLNMKGEYDQAIDQYEDALDKDVEKSLILNQSINQKRNQRSTASSQSFYQDGIDKEDNHSSEEKESPCFKNAKQLQFENTQPFAQQQAYDSKNNNNQVLLRSKSDQLTKEGKSSQNFIKVKSFAESESQSHSDQENKQNCHVPQSAFSKIKSAQQTDDETPTKTTTNTESDEKINEQANFYFTKGYIARHKNDNWKAIELYSHAISLKPDFYKAVFNRGFLFDQLGQYEKAIEDYTRSIEIDNKCTFAYFNRGITQNKLKRYQNAIEDFSNAIKLDSSNSDFYLNRANTYQKLDQHAEAIQDFTYCLHLQTDKLPSILVSRAMSYEKNNEIERARHDYQRAIDSGSDQTHYCYSRLATINLNQENLQHALTYFNNALDLDPDNLYCLSKRAQLYIKLELYKLASEDLTHAIVLKEDLDSLYYYRAKAYKLMGMPIESTEDLLQAVSLESKDPNVYRLLRQNKAIYIEIEQTKYPQIKNMLDLNEYEDSISYINQEIELIGPSKHSLFNRAYCFSKLDKFQDAENDLKQLYEYDQKDIKVLKSLAVCLISQKKYQEAIPHLDIVLESVDKKNAKEYYKYRYECYYNLNETDKAEKDLKMYKSY